MQHVTADSSPVKNGGDEVVAGALDLVVGDVGGVERLRLRQDGPLGVDADHYGAILK